MTKTIPNRDIADSMRELLEFKNNTGSVFAKWVTYSTGVSDMGLDVPLTLRQEPQPDHNRPLRIQLNKLYVVWSYGEHFPLAVYDPDITDKGHWHWFITRREDSPSSTTSRHMSHLGLSPSSAYVTELSLAHMKFLMRHGYKHMAKAKLEGYLDQWLNQYGSKAYDVYSGSWRQR